MPISRTRNFSYRRRPLYMLTLHTGNYAQDPINGLREEWRWNGSNPPSDTGAVSWIIGLFNNAYNLGIRDFLLHMPAGTNEGSNYYGANHWFTIPESRRIQIKQILGQWISSKRLLHAPDYFTFGISISIPIRDDYESFQIDLSEGNMHFPDLNQSKDIQWLKDQVDGWIDVGIDRLWLDGAGDASNRSELGAKSLFEAAVIQKEFYESYGIKTVGGWNLPLQGYSVVGTEITVAGIPIPPGGNIHINNSQAMPFVCTSDWMDLYDKKTQQFYFTYDLNNYTATITDADGDSKAHSNFLTNQGYFVVESEDINNVWYSSNIFERGKYPIDTDNLGPGHFELTRNPGDNTDCGLFLPEINPDDVPAILSKGIINYGRTTQYWILPNGNEEMAIVLNYKSCYTESKIFDLLDRGFRLGVDEDELINFDIVSFYSAWLSNKSVYIKIIRRHN